MAKASFGRRCVRGIAAGLGLGAGLYATYAATTWLRYGRVPAAGNEEADALLDEFMPVFEIVERHHVCVDAPAEVTLAAAREVDFSKSAVVRAIFKGRELAMGTDPDDANRPRGLVPLALSLGWRVLAEIPDREIVLGAVTRPWQANVVFRSIPAGQFAAFDEPDYVKILWNLRADPNPDGNSILRTETRAVATDLSARRKFRRYWSLVSPGIVLIRLFALRLLKDDAERAVHSRSFSP
ncbi:MAG TPA: hypothetical protein VH583_01880 [Vicinamibacterales bacterium]|jgi:hypothetical protein